MRYSIIVVPQWRGHFEYYSDIISKNSTDRTVQLAVQSNLKAFILLLGVIYSCKRWPQKIYFLHGEKHYSAALLIKFFTRTKTSTIFYYWHHQYQAMKKKKLVSLILKLLNLVGVNTFFLESSTNSIEIKDHMILNDPISEKVLKNDRSEISNSSAKATNLLIIGNIDDRKLVTEIIRLCNDLSKTDREPLKIRIAGKSHPSYEASLHQAVTEVDSSYLSVETELKFLSDDDFIMEICNTDIVLALYREHYGSSGVVMSSIALNKPVLFICRGVLKTFAEDLGFKNLPRNESEIHEGLNAIISNPASFKVNDKERQAFMGRRSEKAFAKKIMEQNG